MYKCSGLATASILAFGFISILRADLEPVGIWNGRVGLSIDAVGSNNNPVGQIQAEIPVGATILAAYLYSAGTPHPWYADSPTTLADYNGAGITLDGTAIDNFSALVGATALPARPDIGSWYTARADVTSLISDLAVGGPNYSWTVTEGSKNTRIDGEVLAIIYEHASLPEGSVVLLDGGQATVGETTTVEFAQPLSGVGDPGFFADMSLGISFSITSSQTSTVDVNGTRLTSSAGGIDDGIGSDGGLITAGGVGDSNLNPLAPFSTDSPDDELYSLLSFLNNGDTSLTIATENPSNDDNIFLMGLSISARIGRVNDTPADPSVPDSGMTGIMLLGAGLALAGARRGLRRR